MYSYEDEIAKITGAMSGRPESPALEIEAGRAIEKAFREMVQNKYLYQNQQVDLQPMFSPIQAELSRIAEARKAENPVKLRTPEMDLLRPLTHERFKELCSEVATRPWILSTRHLGDNELETQLSLRARVGDSQPLGARENEMYLGFFLPSVQLYCLGPCKGEKTFSAHAKSRGAPFSQPWGLVKVADTEQLFFPIFRCEGCSKFSYTLLVKRKGLKLQLCGMTPRRPVTIKQKLPESITSILEDAEQSVAEADLFAAIYHLRTLIEHYVKGQLTLSVSSKVNGDDLIAQYYATLSPALRETLPSLLSSWQFLSQALHAREGTVDDYVNHRESVCQHIEVVGTLGGRAKIQPTSA